MESIDQETRETDSGPIYVISGSTGSSGEQLVNTVLAQFPRSKVSVIIVPQIRQVEQIEDVVKRAAKSGGIIVHTLVDESVRGALIGFGQKKGVVTIDLMGSLLSHVGDMLGQKPLGRPGLYRKLRKAHFERIEAIEFSLSHDDGMRPNELHLAEIVLVGLSRVGKSPISMYLAVQGWRVANVPIVIDVPPPSQLFEIDRRRVLGLSIEPDQLLVHRQRRQRELGVSGSSSYTDPRLIFEEVENARKLFRKHGFRIIGVTNKPIETIADEVIKVINRRFGLEDRKSMND